MPDNDSHVEYRHGDRVRVQIDAVGTVTHAGRLHMEVRLDDDFEIVDVLRRHLTPLRPPLALHAEIRVGVDPEPPVGTVLVYVASGWTVKRWRAGWRSGDAASGTLPWSELPRGVACVAWLPPAAQQESS